MIEDDNTGGMGDLSEITAKKTDDLLKEKESALLKLTTEDLNSLKPEISDSASFEKLILAVQVSTQKNEDTAALEKRIGDLGEGVKKVATEVLEIIKNK